MQRKLILTALMAAVAMPTLAPTTAAAQSREVRRERQDLREERRELRQAERRGSARDVREERRDVREARRDVRDARRDAAQDRNRRWGNDDWRSYRNRDRRTFARGSWRAPFRYYGFRTGMSISPRYFSSRYYISNPWRYRLPPAYGNQRWVRHYDDVLLVDVRRGRVIRVIRNFFW